MDSELRSRWTEEALQRTAAAGLRSGTVRAAVIDHFATRGQCLLTAQQVIDALRDHGKGSHASVYRVIEQLSALGLLHRFDARDGVARYEIADPEHHHHHLVDEASGDVRPFADPDLDAAIEAAARRLGLELTSHEIILRGRVQKTGASA